jgi:hypothetical protein
MPMTPFMERFPEVGARETRSVTVTNRQDLPDGEYGFLEFYCNEPGCDCRRVMIDVLRPESGVEQGLGHHQLWMGESGFLQKMGRDRQRFH